MSLQSQPDPTSRRTQSQTRRCAQSDCHQEGLFPAPSERENKDSRTWLCLKHARDANGAWNYYDHKSDEDIEQAVRASAVGYRPTWPMSSYSKQASSMKSNHRYEKRVWENFYENFPNIFVKIFDENPNKYTKSSEQEKNQEKFQKKIDDQRTPRNCEERKACRVLELTPPINAKELKARYRTLAKAHHPDRHMAKNPDEQIRQQEQERLKKINAAYSLLQELWRKQALHKD